MKILWRYFGRVIGTIYYEGRAFLWSVSDIDIRHTIQMVGIKPEDRSLESRYQPCIVIVHKKFGFKRKNLSASKELAKQPIKVLEDYKSSVTQ